jgi:hypothetical protein
MSFNYSDIVVPITPIESVQTTGSSQYAWKLAFVDFMLQGRWVMHQIKNEIPPFKNNEGLILNELPVFRININTVCLRCKLGIAQHSIVDSSVSIRLATRIHC